VCASEGCGSSYDAQPSTYINVNWALPSPTVKPTFRCRKLNSSPTIADAILFPPNGQGQEPIV
jgi:hypothetical protein